MKDKLSTYQAQFTAIPEPLQKQIWFRLGLAMAFLLLFILVLATMADWMAAIPFIGLSVFGIASAGALFSQAVAGRYVVIQGQCIEAATTPIRKRCKSILVQTDRHVVQLMMKQRLKRVPVGVSLEIYVASNTQVYEKDGTQLLHTYLAINIRPGHTQSQC